ncbi:hypothetical protein [Arthrobacter sp. N199823]|uniref:hypothetical protein n=1 Tax=Arthrobacter sp. N199823 TaxID=2058895 RepID=UPI000CE3657D|nr:hypothetical protein [Arthrobacter sp. N199823]
MGFLLVFMLDTLSGGGLTGAGPDGGQISSLGSSLPEYQADMWQAVEAVHNLAVKPVASTVLAIMFVMMLARTSTQVDSDSQLGVRIVAATMFKVAIVFVVVQNAMTILGALLQISIDITQSILTNPAANQANIGTAMKDRIDSMNPMEQLGALIMLLIPFLISVVAVLIPFVLIFIRFLQLFIMAAFASLPLAFLGHEDTKPIAIGYLKAFAATALSGTVMVLVIVLVAKMSFTGWTDFNGEVLPFIAGNFWNMMIAPLVLVFGLLTANGMAKKLVGDG